LTEEQKKISNDFMHYWHEVLPKRYGIVDKFNHTYPVRHAPPSFKTTLEIGCGLGEHIAYEILTQEQSANYHAMDIRTNMVETHRQRYPNINAFVGDCQGRLDFPDGYFDRVLAIHVLEHLPNLPLAIREVHRLCSKQGGFLSVVIPCEGGIAYQMARRISAQRIFESRYHQPYDWFISREHINRPSEIIHELSTCFRITHRSLFPLMVPIVTMNLCIGLTCAPR
jgi:ubiquinone/menaquinone biosynthesis C-methylase UbiE